MELRKVKVKDLVQIAGQVDHYEEILGDGYQREVNDLHKNKIVKVLKKKIKNNETLKMVPIYISERKDGSIYIIDGQHRIAALKDISENEKSFIEQYNSKENTPDFDDTEFNVIYIQNDEDSKDKEKEIFLELNYYGKNVNSSLATIIETKIGDLEEYEKKSVELIEKLHADDNPLKGKFDIGPSKRGKLSYRSLYTTLSNLFNKEFSNCDVDIIFNLYFDSYIEMEIKWNKNENLYKNVGWFTLYYLIKLIWDKNYPVDTNIKNVVNSIKNSNVDAKEWNRDGRMMIGSSMSYYNRNASRICSQD